MEWILETYRGDAHGFWDCYTSRNTASLDSVGERKDKIKESWQAPKILQTGNRLIKLCRCKHMLPFMKEEEWLPGCSHGPRGRNPEPQRIIPVPWNLMEFAQLDFKIDWVWWLLFPFNFLSIVMGMSITVILCLTHHCIWEQITCFLVLKVHRGREILP